MYYFMYYLERFSAEKKAITLLSSFNGSSSNVVWIMAELEAIKNGVIHYKHAHVDYRETSGVYHPPQSNESLQVERKFLKPINFFPGSFPRVDPAAFGALLDGRTSTSVFQWG